LWLLGLWIAAPLLRGKTSSHADRLRDALVLGVAIPLVLGLVNLLVPLALWIALAACVIGGLLRARNAGASASAPEPVPYLLVTALALVTWPALVRPLLEGDSLAYHLPNAAMWAHAHNIWGTATFFWWYPPASELFASGLFGVSGPYALGWSGALPLALLGLRTATYARERFGASPLLADAAAATLVTMQPIALQAGTMQNDVWLAAFLLETAVTPSAAAAGVTALLKPYGALLGIITLAAKRAAWPQWLAAALCVCVWGAHDLILNARALIPIEAMAIANPWSTTILAHGAGALALFVRVLAALSPLGLAAFFAALASPLFGKYRPPFALAACACTLWYFVMPFGYDNPGDQLGNGASLRFAAPAFAFGTLAIVRLLPNAQPLLAGIFAASAAAGAFSITALFWNDATTRTGLLAAALAVAVVFVARRTRLGIIVPAAVAAAVVIGAHLAGRAPIPYFVDTYAEDGARPGIFAWIAGHRPERAMTWGLRSGAVNVLSPQTVSYDAVDSIDPCGAARRAGATLIVTVDRDVPQAFPARRERARACGTVVFEDALGIAVQPHS
jgi:hypothetical protein